MDTGDWVSAGFSLLAVIISAVTAYLTLIARFKGMVLPKRWPIFFNLNTGNKRIPCLVLACEFVNDGAKPGLIEDIKVEFYDLQRSFYQVDFVPYRMKDQFNLFQNYQDSDFTQFNGISLGAKQRKESYIVFKPMGDEFVPGKGEFMIKVKARGNRQKKWRSSPVDCSFRLDEQDVTLWMDPSGHQFQVQAREIGELRMEERKKKIVRSS